MSRRGFWKMPAILLAIGLVTALVFTGCPTEVTPDIAWSAEADDAVNTTAINIRFNAPVDELTREDIVLVAAGGPGSVEIAGDPVGGGRLWTLPISVMREGNIEIAINRSGISSRPTVISAGTQGLGVTITVTTPVTTAIRFNFDEAITELTTDQIFIENGIGSVQRTENLTGSGRLWSLEVVPLTEGTIRVWIERPGIVQEARTQTVGLNTWQTRFDIADSIIEFRFTVPVPELDIDDILVTDLTGAVTKGDLAMSRDNTGRFWTLEVTTEQVGTVHVSIDRPGILPNPASGTFGAPDGTNVNLIEWAAGMDAANVILLSFGTPMFPINVADLVASEIEIHEGIGAATLLGVRRGTDNLWLLDVEVERAGSVGISIDRAGIFELGDADAAFPPTVSVELALPATDLTFNAAEGGIVLGFVDTSGNTVQIPTLAANQIRFVTTSTYAVTSPPEARGNYWFVPVTFTPLPTDDPQIVVNRTGVNPIPRDVSGVTATTWVLDTTDHAGATAAITFKFGTPVDLQASDIQIESITGEVTVAPGAVLTGFGTLWSLPITVVRDGDVRVAINRAGIAPIANDGGGPIYEGGILVGRSVPVSSGNVNWIATAAINEDTSVTTAIVLSFAQPVTLAHANISIRDAGGSVVAPVSGLSGSGTLWTIPVTGVTSPGDVQIAINQAGIITATHTVQVDDGSGLNITAGVASRLNDEGRTVALDFTFSQPVNLAPANIVVRDGGASVTTGALTGSGTLWSLAVTDVSVRYEWWSLQWDAYVQVVINNVNGVNPQPHNVRYIGDGTGAVLNDWSYTLIQTGGVTTAIRFNFDEPVSGLTNANVFVANNTAQVTAGAMTGGGRLWTLALGNVTVNQLYGTGSVFVAINAEGVTPASQQISNISDTPTEYTIYWSVVPTHTDRVTTALSFHFTSPVTDLDIGHIGIANGTAQIEWSTNSLTGNGRLWTLPITDVTFYQDGAIDGNVLIVITHPSIAPVGHANTSNPPSSQPSGNFTSVIVQNNPLPPPAGISWNVQVNDPANTTQLIFSFNEPVANLVEADFQIYYVPLLGGAAVPGSPTGVALGSFQAVAGSDNRLWQRSVTINNALASFAPRTLMIQSDSERLAEAPWWYGDLGRSVIVQNNVGSATNISWDVRVIGNQLVATFSHALSSPPIDIFRLYDDDDFPVTWYSTPVSVANWWNNVLGGGRVFTQSVTVHDDETHTLRFTSPILSDLNSSIIPQVNVTAP